MDGIRSKKASASSTVMSSTSAMVLPLKGDFQGFAVVPFAAAGLALHVYVGQKVHFNFYHAVALARLAPARPSR